MDYKLYSLLLALGVVSGYGNAQEVTDTVKVIDNARNIVVTRDGDKTKVEADYENDNGMPMRFLYEVAVNSKAASADEFDDDWGMDLPFVKTRSIDREDETRGGKVRTWRYVTGFRHIYWGWRFNYGDKGHVKNCFEAGIRDLIGVSWQRRGAELEIGAGIGMKRFLADDGFIYSGNGDSVLIGPYSGDGEVVHSRMDFFLFHVPVIYTQRIYKELKFSVGGVVNFNTYAKAFTETRIKKSNNKMNFKGLQQNLVTVDALLSINLAGMGLYGCWSPVELFKKDYGPAVKAWSIGVELDF